MTDKEQNWVVSDDDLRTELQRSETRYESTQRLSANQAKELRLLNRVIRRKVRQNQQLRKRVKELEKELGQDGNASDRRSASK